MSQAFGCARCFGDDAATAWAASRATRLRSLIEESHFAVQLTACACGQRFATVFTERIDWSGGQDAQDWLVLPVTDDEARRLEASAPDVVPGLVKACSRGRRFLVRSFPTGGALESWWRDGGFGIGPHD